MNKRLFRLLCVTGALLAATFSLAGNVLATAPDKHSAGQESLELMNALDDAIASRVAPNLTVAAGAYLSAAQAAAGTTETKGSWSEVGPYNYFTDDPNYADPQFSNSGAGDRYASGRITALAATSDGQTVVAGGADGGLWRSVNGGSWTPVGDQLYTLSIGALAVDDQNGRCVFVAGTGEANTNFDAYAGVGIYRSADCGATWTRIGPDSLNGKLIWSIHRDPNVQQKFWAATSDGVYVSTDDGQTWSVAFRAVQPSGNTFVDNQFTDVAVQPVTGTIVAADGWRNGSAYNGLYVSTNGGRSFSLVANPQGWMPQTHEGRVTLAYSADGSQLYAIDEDPTLLVNPSHGIYSVLNGVYVAKNANVNGPWTQIANPTILMNSGSAENISAGMRGYQPGVQAWYNQFLAVDPSNPSHLYLGLEEVYESLDGGSTWNTIGPYWNFTLPCFSYTPFEGTCDPNQTHSDQHAAYIANGTLWVGNDGGVSSRLLTNHAVGKWTNLNQSLGTLQFYSASAGQGSGQPLTYFGGLQDNGTAKVVPSQNLAVQPFGGDGGFTVVDPANPNNVMTEYVDLLMANTTNGGHTWNDIAPGDPNPRFIAPFGTDRVNSNTVVAGGEYVWVSKDGVGGTTKSSWQNVADSGAGHSITALDSAGGTIYAAWCGPCNSRMSDAPAGTGFVRGIVTNYNGGWHQLSMTGLPNRFISGLYEDPANSAHAYITFSGFSRNWIVGPNDPGVGHVYETKDGGNSWTDISANLIDAPALSVIAANGHLVVGTDIGVFESSTMDGGTWTKLGTNLPNVSVWQLTLTPAKTILAATHGRGLWTFPTSKL